MLVVPDMKPSTEQLGTIDLDNLATVTGGCGRGGGRKRGRCGACGGGQPRPAAPAPVNDPFEITVDVGGYPQAATTAGLDVTGQSR